MVSFSREGVNVCILTRKADAVLSVFGTSNLRDGRSAPHMTAETIPEAEISFIVRVVFQNWISRPTWSVDQLMSWAATSLFVAIAFGCLNVRRRSHMENYRWRLHVHLDIRQFIFILVFGRNVISSFFPSWTGSIAHLSRAVLYLGKQCHFFSTPTRFCSAFVFASFVGIITPLCIEIE
jgi:hypothetical protein